MIVVDTCILSAAFRRKNSPTEARVELFRQMIVEDWALAIPGIVLQEFLTGFRLDRQFQRARRVLQGFPVLLANQEDHELAARIRSQCLAKGIAGHGIDCLIAALTINRKSRLMTADADFVKMSQICDLKLI